MTYSTSDLSHRADDILAEAVQRPVTLTRRNKPHLVFMAIEGYRRLVERADARKAHTLESMTDDLFEDFKRGVDLYAAEKESS